MICDTRLVDKPYGRRIWQSLPPFKRTREIEVVEEFFAEHRAAKRDIAASRVPSARSYRVTKPGCKAGFLWLRALRGAADQNCHHDFFAPGRAWPVTYGLSGNVPASTRFVSSASCGWFSLPYDRTMMCSASSMAGAPL